MAETPNNLATCQIAKRLCGNDSPGDRWRVFSNRIRSDFRLVFSIEGRGFSSFVQAEGSDPLKGAGTPALLQ